MSGQAGANYPIEDTVSMVARWLENRYDELPSISENTARRLIEDIMNTLALSPRYVRKNPSRDLKD